jgi:transcriptional regulator GlxA family with amidase domain
LRTETDSYNAGLGYVLLRAWAAHLANERPVLSADLHPAVEKAARLLQSHREDMSLPAIARAAGLSAARLSRLFKQQTGVSLVDFRNRQRLDTALGLYGRGQRVTLLEAALAAGFGSYVQFYRVFRRLLRRTPARYCREQREAGDG